MPDLLRLTNGTGLSQLIAQVNRLCEWAFGSPLVVAGDLTVPGKLTVSGSLALPPGSITTPAIATNAVQQQLASYVLATTWSTTVINAWVATAVTVSFTSGGGLLRVDMSMPLCHSIVAAGFYIGYMIDGVISSALAYYTSPGQSYGMNFGMTIYTTTTAGPHTLTLAVYNATAGTFSVLPQALATLYVTEQKR